MKKLILIVIEVFLLSTSFAFASEMMTIKIPQYEWNDNTETNILSWKKYSVPKSSAVLTAVYKKMFGANFESVTINKDGVAKLKIKTGSEPYSSKIYQTFYPEMWPLGAYAVNDAAFQFPTVKKLEVYLNEKLYDWCENDVRDGCRNDDEEGNEALGEAYKTMYWIANRDEWLQNKKYFEVNYLDEGNVCGGVIDSNGKIESEITFKNRKSLENNNQIKFLYNGKCKNLDAKVKVKTKPTLKSINFDVQKIILIVLFSLILLSFLWYNTKHYKLSRKNSENKLEK